MNRSDFFKSFVGLIGVAVSVKELALISTPIYHVIPKESMVGDIVMNNSHECFLFDGKFIRPVTGKQQPFLAKLGDGSNYLRFANAFREI